MTAPLPGERPRLVVSDRRTLEQRRASGHLYAALRRRGKAVPQIAFEEDVPETRVYDDLRAAGYSPARLRNAVNNIAAAPDPVPEEVLEESGRRFARLPLGDTFVAMLHQIRDEIKAADRLAIARERLR